MNWLAIALVALAVLAAVLVVVVVRSGPPQRRARIHMLLDRRECRRKVTGELLSKAVAMVFRRGQGYRTAHDDYDAPLMDRARELLAGVIVDVDAAAQRLAEVRAAIEGRDTLEAGDFQRLEAALLSEPVERPARSPLLRGLPTPRERPPTELHTVIDEANRGWTTVSVLLDLVDQHVSKAAAEDMVRDSLERARAALVRAQGKRARMREPLERAVSGVTQLMGQGKLLDAIEQLPALHRCTRSVSAAAGAQQRAQVREAKQRHAGDEAARSGDSIDWTWYEPEQ